MGDLRPRDGVIPDGRNLSAQKRDGLPGLIGLGVLAIVSWRTAGKPGARSAILLAALCWGLAAFTAPLAWAGLMSNFGG